MITLRAEIRDINMPGYNSIVNLDGDIPAGYAIAEMQVDGGERFVPYAPGRLLVNEYAYDVQSNATVWLVESPIADGK